MDYPSYKDIPEELRKGVRFIGSIKAPGERSTRIEAAEFHPDINHVRFKGLIMETSDKAEGVVLKERWSFVDELYIGGAYTWMVRPIATEEK